MDLSLIRTRLRAQVATTLLKSIGGAADLAAAEEISPVPGTGYVVPLAERADASVMLGAHIQNIEETFGVIVVVSNKRDSTGGAAADDLRATRLAIRSALLGWVPTGCIQPINYLGGRMIRFADQRLWWSDEFRTFTEYRSL